MKFANFERGFRIKTIKSLGNDLLSQAVTHQVPSALTGLTNGFGMCPGVPLSLQSPRDSIYMLRYQRIMIYNSRFCEFTVRFSRYDFQRTKSVEFSVPRD